MNIFLRELKANGKPLVIWCISMFVLLSAGMVKYSSFAAVGESANKIFDQLPIGLKVIFGLAGLDLTSIGSFYSVFFLYFILIVGVHAAMTGAVIISKEERDKTADFILPKPVSRRRIVVFKLLAGFVNLVVLNAATWLSSIIFINMYNTGPSINDRVAVLMVALFMLQIVYFSLGAGISSIVRNTRRATSFATFVLLGTFILSVVVDLNSDLDYLRYFTPFKYFAPMGIIRGAGFETISVLLVILISAVSLAAAFVFYDKRDIHA